MGLPVEGNGLVGSPLPFPFCWNQGQSQTEQCHVSWERWVTSILLNRKWDRAQTQAGRQEAGGGLGSKGQAGMGISNGSTSRASCELDGPESSLTGAHSPTCKGVTRPARFTLPTTISTAAPAKSLPALCAPQPFILAPVSIWEPLCTCSFVQ